MALKAHTLFRACGNDHVKHTNVSGGGDENMKNATLPFIAIVAIASLMSIGWPERSLAETGRVSLNVTKVGFIVGVGGGSGTLSFKGRTYRLALGGVSAGTIGAAGA